MKPIRIYFIPSFAALMTSTSMAAFTPITPITINNIPGTPPQYLLQSLTAGAGNTIASSSLVTGTTTGSPSGGSIANMDNFNLNLASTGNGSWTKTVLFGGANFTDSNGSLPDFFLFEASANTAGGPDDVSIAAIFPDDSIGVAVVCPTAVDPAGWGYTGFQLSSNAPVNNNQFITGLAWDITDLKDASGNFLPAGSTIKGVQILPGSSIDPCGFYAIAPPPPFAKLAVSAPLTPVGVDVPFQIIITAQDQGGATVPNNTTTVAISGLGSNPAGSLMEFDWNQDGTYGDFTGLLVNGMKTINARNKKAQTVTLSASAGSALTPEPPDVVTTPGAFSKLQILAPGETAAPGTTSGKTGTPNTLTFGTPQNFTVNAVDAFWNPAAPIPSDTITVTSTDGTAVLPSPADIPTTSGQYPVTFNAAGLFTVTATDTTDGTKTASTTPVITVLGDTSLIWSGNTTVVDESGDVWDTDPLKLNWNLEASPFAESNQVTFNVDGASFPSVRIPGTVTPSKVTVNNPFGTDYLFEGAGSIAGAVGGFLKQNTGFLYVSTANTYSGATSVTGGVLIVQNASAIPSASSLTLNGGLIGVQSVDFTRSPGLGVGQVNLQANCGFAAFGTEAGDTAVVNFGGNTTPDLVTFGTPGMLESNLTFVLGHPNSDRTIEILNPMALRNGQNFFQVPDGGADVDAKLSGAISTPLGGTGFSKTGDGILILSNPGNSFGQAFVDNGTIMLGANDVMPGGALTLKKADGSVSGILDLNGFSDTIGVLNMGDSVAASQEPRVIDTKVNSTAVLTLGGNLVFRSNAQAIISANLKTVATTGNRNITVNNGAADVPEDLLITGNLTGDAITKLGAGTLAVEKPLYSGSTTVSAGIFTIRKTETQTNANPNNDAATVTIAETGATLKLEFSGTDIVGPVTIGATTYTSGILGGSPGEGVTVVPQITGTGTLTIVSDPYLTWAGAGVAFDGDANNDGVENGLAWLLGAANPNVNANSLLPMVSQMGGGLKLTFDMLPATVRDGAQLFVEHSSDLGIGDDWVGVLVPDATGGAAPVTFSVTDSDEIDLENPLDVEATISSTASDAGKLFGRVRAER